MSLKTKVKAGNISNLSDARYFAGVGSDWLGFPAHNVNPVMFKEITDWVTGPQFVLEAQELKNSDSILDYPVSIIQINALQLNWIDSFPDKIWIVLLPVSEWNELKHSLLNHKESISCLIIELNETLHLTERLHEISTHFTVLADFHPEEHALEDLISMPVQGINISGGNELKPGLKDFDSLAAIFDALEEAE